MRERKAIKKRLLALVLAFAMVLGSVQLPGLTMTAEAAGSVSYSVKSDSRVTFREGTNNDGNILYFDITVDSKYNVADLVVETDSYSYERGVRVVKSSSTTRNWSGYIYGCRNVSGITIMAYIDGVAARTDIHSSMANIQIADQNRDPIQHMESKFYTEPNHVYLDTMPNYAYNPNVSQVKLNGKPVDIKWDGGRAYVDYYPYDEPLSWVHEYLTLSLDDVDASQPLALRTFNAYLPENLDGISFSGPPMVLANTEYILTATLQEGRKIEDFNLYNGEQLLAYLTVDGNEYTYIVPNVGQDLHFRATGAATKQEYTVDFVNEMPHVTLTNSEGTPLTSTKVKHGDTLDLRIKAEAGYKLGEVKLNLADKQGNTPTDMVEGYYKDNTWYAALSNVTKDIVVTLTGNVTQNPFTVNIPGAVENVSFYGDNSVEAGGEYTMVAQVPAGYNINTLRVLCNGTTILPLPFEQLALGRDMNTYTYKVSNVDKDLQFTTEGKAERQTAYVAIENVMDNATLVDESGKVLTTMDEIPYGTTVKIILKPDEGYTFTHDSDIELLVYEDEYGSEEVDLYNYKDGMLIGEYYVEYDSHFRATGSAQKVVPGPYKVAVPDNLQNVTFGGKTTVADGNDYTLTAEVAEGYDTNMLEVYCNGYKVTPTYMGDGTFEYTIEAVQQDLTFTTKGEAQKSEYTVTLFNAMQHVKLTDKDGNVVTSLEKVPFGTILSLLVEPEDGYSIEEMDDLKFTFTGMDGGPEIPGFYYQDGKMYLSFPVMGNMMLALSGDATKVVPGPYSVAVPDNMDGVKFSGETTAEDGNSYTLTADLAEGYNMDNMEVYCNGFKVSPDSSYARASATIITYTIEKVSSNLAFTVKGKSDVSGYSVDFQNEMQNATLVDDKGNILTALDKVAYGTTLTMMVKANDGYVISSNEDVEVIISNGSTTLPTSCYYKDGMLYVSFKVTKDTVVNVTGTATKVVPGPYKVSVPDNMDGVKFSGETTVENESSYTLTAHLSEGYNMDTMEVYCNGFKVSPDSSYARASATIITYTIDKVSSDLAFTVKGKADVSGYSVNFQNEIQNTTLVDDKGNILTALDKVAYGTTLTMMVKANDGYVISSNEDVEIIISNGSTTLPSSCYYKDGMLYVSFKVTKDTVVNVTGTATKVVPGPYNVKMPANMEGIKFSGETSVEDGTDYTMTAKVEDAYLIGSMEVYCNGFKVSPVVNEAGEYEYTLKNVQQNLAFTTDGKLVGKTFTVNFNNRIKETVLSDENGKTLTAMEKVPYGKTVTMVLKAKDKYVINNDVKFETVTAEGKTESIGCYYENGYIYSTCKITSDTTIDVGGSSAEIVAGPFSVKIPENIDGVEFFGLTSIKAGEDYVLTAEVADGYSIEKLTVYCNGIKVSPDLQEDGAYTYTVNNVGDDLVFTASGKATVATYSVDFKNTIEHVIVTNEKGELITNMDEVAYGTTLTLLISAEKGYSIDGDVDVTVRDQNASEGKKVACFYKDGVLYSTITVKSDLEVTISGKTAEVVPGPYSVQITENIANVQFSGETVVKYGNDYIMTAKVTDGYTIDGMTVYCNNIKVSPVLSRDDSNVYTYTIKNVSQDLKFTATGNAAVKTYKATILNNIDNTTIYSDKYGSSQIIWKNISYGEEVVFKVKADKGYVFDKTVVPTMKVGEVVKDLIYNAADGSYYNTFTVTKDISVEFDGKTKEDLLDTYNVTFPQKMAGLTYSADPRAEGGMDYEFNVTVKDGYTIGDFRLYCNAKAVNPTIKGNTYTYVVPHVISDLVFTAAGSAEQDAYTVTFKNTINNASVLNSNGQSIAKFTGVTYGQTVEFMVKADTSYELKNDILVKSGDTTVETYTKNGIVYGSYKVTADTTLTVTGTTKDKETCWVTFPQIEGISYPGAKAQTVYGKDYTFVVEKDAKYSDSIVNVAANFAISPTDKLTLGSTGISGLKTAYTIKNVTDDINVTIDMYDLVKLTGSQDALDQYTITTSDEDVSAEQKHQLVVNNMLYVPTKTPVTYTLTLKDPDALDAATQPSLTYTDANGTKNVKLSDLGKGKYQFTLTTQGNGTLTANKELEKKQFEVLTAAEFPSNVELRVNGKKLDATNNSVEYGSNFTFTSKILDVSCDQDPLVIKANGIELKKNLLGNYVIENVTKTQIITVETPKKNTYKINLPGKDSVAGLEITPVDGTSVEYGGSFKFRVRKDTNYDGSRVVVSFNGKTDAIEGTKEGDLPSIKEAGTYYQIDGIQGDITIAVGVDQYLVRVKRTDDTAAEGASVLNDVKIIGTQKTPINEVIKGYLQVPYDSPCTFKLDIPNTGKYDLSTLKVFYNGSEIKPYVDTHEYTLEEMVNDSVLEIKLERTSNTVNFAASNGVTYEDVDGKTVTGADVYYGDDYSFRIAKNADHSKSRVKVFVDGKELLASNDGYYTIKNVIEKKNVTVNVKDQVRVQLPLDVALITNATVLNNAGTIETEKPTTNDTLIYYVPCDSRLELIMELPVSHTQSNPVATLNGNAVDRFKYSDTKYRFTTGVIDGNSVENISLVSINKYNVTLPVITGVKVAPVSGYKTTAIEYDNEFRFTVTKDVAYSKCSPVVKVNGVIMIPDSKGVYSIKNIRENQVVSVSGVQINTYKVSIPKIAGSSARNSYGYDSGKVVYGKDYKFTLRLLSSYSKSPMIVKVDNQILIPNSAGEYTIKCVTSDKQVVINGVRPNVQIIAEKSTIVPGETIQTDVINVPNGSPVHLHNCTPSIISLDENGNVYGLKGGSGKLMAFTMENGKQVITYKTITVKKKYLNRNSGTKNVDGINYVITKKATKSRTGEVTVSRNQDNKKLGSRAVIPAYVKISGRNYRVTAIGQDAFMGCKGLKSVSIPRTVTKIASTAFLSCINLKTFTVDKKNRYFSANKGMLLNLSGRTLVAYPSATGKITVGGKIREIGAFALSSVDNLKQVTVGSGVKKIGYCAFAHNSTLKKVILKNKDANAIECNCTFNEVNSRFVLAVNKSRVAQFKEKCKAGLGHLSINVVAK